MTSNRWRGCILALVTLGCFAPVAPAEGKTITVAADGSDKMTGTNVFQFGSNGTIQSVIGLNA